MRVKNRDLLVKILSAIGELPQGLLYEHTATGNPATFNTNVAKAVEMEIPFTPVQDLHGYDYPWPSGGGLNLFNKDDSTLQYSGYIEATTGKYTTGSGLSTRTVYIPCKANTSYIISNDVTTTLRVASFTALPTTNTNSTAQNAPTGATTAGMGLTITTGASDAYLLIQVMANDDITGGMTLETALAKLMVEEGSTVHTWQPYSNICPITGFTGCDIIVSPTLDAQDGTTYSISWQTEAGIVYGGTLTVNKDGTGSLIVDKVMIIFDGTTETWNTSVTTTGYFTSIASLDLVSPQIPIANFVQCFTNGSSSTLTKWKARINASGNNFIVCPDLTIYTTPSSFAEYLTTHNLQVVFTIATPFTYTLTAEQIKTILGTNNIWTNTNGTNTIKYLKRG